MARALKPYKIDDVRSPNGYTFADVMFDRNRKEFFVEIVPGDTDSRVTSDTLADVKTKAAEALARAQKYAWMSLIMVGVSETWYRSDSQNTASLRLEFRRFERSPNPAYPDRFVERDHALDASKEPGPNRDDRERHRDISPYSGRETIGPADDANENALLPYSQDVWDGLVAIKSSIEDARKKLEALLQHKDVSRVLVLGARSNHAAALRGVRLLAEVGDD